jgi:hypothetical protein
MVCIRVVSRNSAFEDFLHWKFEELPYFQGQWQARIVFLGFDGVDGLAGYLESFGKIALRPGTGGAKFPESIFHRLNGSAIASIYPQHLGIISWHTPATGLPKQSPLKSRLLLRCSRT